MQPSTGRDRPSKPPSSRTPRVSPLRLDIAARTDRGLEREHNEDSLLVSSFGGLPRLEAVDEAREVARDGWAALAVCDGMGGAAGGEIASRRTAEVIAEILVASGSPATRDALG